MKITRDVRDYAAKLEEAEAGMAEKSAEFRQKAGRCICRCSAPPRRRQSRRIERQELLINGENQIGSPFFACWWFERKLRA